MATEADPIVGHWYQHLDKGQKFVVVALDDNSRCVEIQHFDGDVEEIDVDVWYQLDLAPCEVPEDWTGPIDDIERDDLGYTDSGMAPEDWNSSLEELKGPPK